MKTLSTFILSLIDYIPILAWSSCSRGGSQHFNLAWLEFTGKNCSDSDLGDWLDSVHVEDRGQVSLLWQSLQAMGTSGRIELRLRRADERYFRFLLKISPVLGDKNQPVPYTAQSIVDRTSEETTGAKQESGSVVAWYGIFIDIDESRNVDDALRRREQEFADVTQRSVIGELTASIAHEVNQPLAAIVTNSAACLKWLSADPPNLEKAREVAEWMMSDGTDTALIIQRLNSLFGRAPLSREPLNMNVLISQILDSCLPHSRESKCL
jgi:C4-dicarboxylate-specific signal transduction histidine kinase